jgi:chromosome segregation ATPase
MVKGAEDREEAHEDTYDRRDARLDKLSRVIEEWRGRPEDQDRELADRYYQEAGRLRARLEATRHSLEELRERGDLRELRDDIDEAISELEQAVAKAAPRYQ